MAGTQNTSCLEFSINYWVVATQIFLELSSLFGEMIQFDEHIFQMGWFNHQLDYQGAEIRHRDSPIPDQNSRNGHFGAIKPEGFPSAHLGFHQFQSCYLQVPAFVV